MLGCRYSTHRKRSSCPTEPHATGRLGRKRVVLIGGNMETGWSDPVTNPGLMLVEVSKGGDLTAFEKLVDRYQGRLFHLALGITRNREDTEDVVQKSFLQAFVHLDTFHGDSKF